MLIAMRTLSPSIVPLNSPLTLPLFTIHPINLQITRFALQSKGYFHHFNWGFQKERRRKEVDEFRTESFRRRSIVSQSRRGSE